MSRNPNQRRQPAGQRQLRVGEEIRHVLSGILLRDEVHDPELRGSTITISEVRISPDLKNATVYFMPLNGEKREQTLAALKRLAPFLRTLVGGKMKLRYTPRLGFQLDNSFDEANRINVLLNNPKVRGDLAREDEDDAADNED